MVISVMHGSSCAHKWNLRSCVWLSQSCMAAPTVCACACLRAYLIGVMGLLSEPHHFLCKYLYG